MSRNEPGEHTDIVSIVGGHGSVARLLTPLLTARGYTVRGLVRSEGQFDDLRADGAEPVLCDLERDDDDQLDAALASSDIVVFAAGAGAGSGPERKKTLDRDGAVRSVHAAVRAGSDRFITISSMGADAPPDDDETFSVYLRAKADADEAARGRHRLDDRASRGAHRRRSERIGPDRRVNGTGRDLPS